MESAIHTIVENEVVSMFGRSNPEVLVIGAGPVGLFSAVCLAEGGVKVQIVDKEWRTGAHSYALALHPGSLSLLKKLQLADAVLKDAYQVRTVAFYEESDRKAEVRLSDLDTEFPFLAAMRQDVFESLLEDTLKRLGVRIHWEHEASEIQPREGSIQVTLDQLEKASTGYAVSHIEKTIAKTFHLDAPFVIGADGHRSRVRRALGIDYTEVHPSSQFAVFEFKTDADLGDELRVVMQDQTTSAVWPLPGGYCRWSFQMPGPSSPEVTRQKDRLMVQIGGGRFPGLSEDDLRRLLSERAPWFKGSIDELNWKMVVRFERRLAASFGKDRTWLAGDAAHITGPVGIQSMNVGLREGHDLAAILTSHIKEGTPLKAMDTYNKDRIREWNQLQGIECSLKADAGANPWVVSRSERILPCLPASGDDLKALLKQIGLHFSS